MASGSPDLMTNKEPAEVQEECSGKKKSKFQTFKNFFARKKRKEPETADAEAGLTASQSSDNVSKTSENNPLSRSEKDKGSGSKISLGSKALSHDSVFVSESSETNEGLGASQDSIHGKVKSLQHQLKQAIRLGSPPSLMCVKKTEDAGTMSEDDGLPCSPPEYMSHRTATNQVQRNSSNSLQEIDSDDDKLSCAASSRAMSPQVVPGDFSQPASPFVCLDNSAAKHKMGLRHKACNKRKPASRLELKAGDTTEDEVLTVSLPGAEEQDRERTKDESGDQLKPKLERKEEEQEIDEEEMEEKIEEDEEDRKDEEGEKGQEQVSTSSLLRDEDGKDELEAEQEVSHAPDTSYPHEPSLSEEEVSSSSSSRASSPDSPRASPAPPAGLNEDSLGPTGTSCEAEDLLTDTDSVSEGEDVLQSSGEEESSFLEEVLSSLKTPLVSHSPDVETERVALEMKEKTRESEEEVVETEGGVVIKQEEAEEDDSVGYQPASYCSVLSDQTSEEEEAVPNYTSQEEEVEVGEEVKGGEEEENFVEEDLIVEQVAQCNEEEDTQREEEGVKSEEASDTLTRQSAADQEEEEGEEEAEDDEGEEAATEEKPGVEEGVEKSEAEYDDEEMEEGRTAEEEKGDGKDDEEEMTEMILEEEVQTVLPSQEEEDDDDDDAQNTKYTNDEITTEMEDQILAREQEEDLKQKSGDERKVEEEAELLKQESVEVETNQPDLRSDETMQLIQNESGDAAEQTRVPSKPPLSLPETRSNTHADEGAVSPSSRATILNINLVSPSSEKATSFQLHPAAADPSDSVTESPPSSVETTDLNTDEEQAGSPKDEESEQSIQQRDDSPLASVQEIDPSKVRFTVAPAWQRSQSQASSSLSGHNLPSPVSEPRGDEEDQGVKAETISAPSPGSTAAEGTPAAESSVIVEGNPESPFGVRLRKTSTLRHFSSEEETVEPPAQPICCKTGSPQPLSDKTSACLPNNNKPALPKKPDMQRDAGGKSRCISEPAPGRGFSGGSDPPSWISVAKQKQKVYKENSLEKIPAEKEEPERKSQLQTSATNRKHSNDTHECTNKGGHSEVSNPSVEKETRSPFSPPTPVPPQPLKSQLLPCPVAPKPQVPPPPAKHPPRSSTPQISQTLPTPVPVPLKSTSCAGPSHLSKTATPAQTPAITSPTFSSRTPPEKSSFRAPGPPRQTVSPQRDLPSPALPPDEPPWMALAKKKAKAWSEMPQIVQ